MRKAHLGMPGFHPNWYMEKLEVADEAIIRNYVSVIRVSRRWVRRSHLRIITPAVNVIFRFPGYSVEPYLGTGIGVFWAHLSDSAGSDNDIAPGVNALGGLRFYVNEEVALFTEYKYNYTKFKFTDSNFKATYSSHGFFGGLSYHF